MSQRILIVGTNESGKTTLANRLIKDASIPVFVRDPIRAEWSRCDARFSNSDELRALLDKQKKQPCIAVIDESADFFSISEKENHWIFTQGRHDAMLPIAIAQRLKMMAPNVRDCATDLYVFEVSPEAAGILAEAYNMPQLESASDLSQGEFFHVRRVNGKRILTEHALW
jgi:hypothetical protein